MVACVTCTELRVVVCAVLCAVVFVFERLRVLPVMRWGEGLSVLWVEFKLREVVKMQRSGVRGLAGRDTADLDLTMLPDSTHLNLK